MNKLHIFFKCLVLTSLVVSCGEEDNVETTGSWELMEATPTSPASNAMVVLNQALPATKIKFEWQPAQVTNRFGVRHTFMLVPRGSQDLTNPLLKITPGNGGKNSFAEITARELDYLFWKKCHPAGAVLPLDWVVMAQALDKVTVARQAVDVKRYATEYIPETFFITGSATENGVAVQDATPMRSLKDANGNATGVFDVYTKLTAGSTYTFRDKASETSKTFGGSDGVLQGCSEAINATETGQYRITVNLNTNTYTLLKIDRWSLVGDAVQGGWGGDVPLEYKGNSVWGATIEFFKPYPDAACIFRANGDWAYVLKLVKGTATSNGRIGKVIMESEAGGAGLQFEDIPGPSSGIYNVTLALAAGAHTYTFEKKGEPTPISKVIGETTNAGGDAVSGEFLIGNHTIPAELYLVSDGVSVATLAKDGQSFRSNNFLALEKAKKYIINSKSDGTGTTYQEDGDGDMAIARDQAYQLVVNFETGKLSWKYYNMKLFHWDEVGGGWDARKEYVMKYVHPRTFEVTGALTAGYHSKFISPWDVEFGTAGTTLTGSMTNGGDRFTGIVQSGDYKATIIVSDNFATCEYAFVKQ